MWCSGVLGLESSAKCQTPESQNQKTGIIDPVKGFGV